MVPLVLSEGKERWPWCGVSVRGFMVRVTGLGESGKNKTGEGLVWGMSMTEYTRKHSRHEKTSVPSDRVAHTNPTAKEAVRNCVGIMAPS